jgi:putative ATPase
LELFKDEEGAAITADGVTSGGGKSGAAGISAASDRDGMPLAGMPLAWRVRPRNLSGLVGQGHLTGGGAALARLVENDSIVSVIFYGPPGTGKTALAHIIAEKTKALFIEINAVTAGIKEIREAVSSARMARTIVFIDEIHRFNKLQQDALLPHIEKGRISMIGASTVNPFFALTPALSSRTIIFKFNPLSPDDLKEVLKRALADPRGLGGRCGSDGRGVEVDEEALDYIAQKAEGDARRALNILELAWLSAPGEEKNPGEKSLYEKTPGEEKTVIGAGRVREAVNEKCLYYDENEHYDVISAFIKSMRGGDPDASVYWLARMLEAGEDPLFIARRIVICASEDVGNADPRALGVAVAAFMAVERIGMPEGAIPLSQAAIYAAQAPKSNACCAALGAAMDAVRNEPLDPVPDHLKGAGYKGASRLGVGGYVYPHDHTGHYVKQDYMKINRELYKPSDQGFEKIIGKRLRRREA